MVLVTGHKIIHKVSGEDTGGAYSMAEVHLEGDGEHQHHDLGRLDCVDYFLPPKAGAVDTALVNPHPYPGRAHPLHKAEPAPRSTRAKLTKTSALMAIRRDAGMFSTERAFVKGEMTG